MLIETDVLFLSLVNDGFCAKVLHCLLPAKSQGFLLRIFGTKRRIEQESGLWVGQLPGEVRRLFVPQTAIF